MNYPFRVCGRIVEVYRFRVDYEENGLPRSDGLAMTGEDGAATPTVRNCHTREEADAVAEQTGGTVTALDTAAYEWLDGLTMPDVPDTYGAAVKVCEMGEAEYRRQLSFQEKKKADQLRADLDYVMLMGGL